MILTDKKDIRKALIESGKEEFLASGYLGASLRKICKNAGVTTGAFYRYFSSKEELFNTLVEEPLEDYYAMYYGLIQNRANIQLTVMDNELEAIRFIMKHKELFLLLFDCAKGTKYENFKENLIHIFDQTYQELYDNYAKEKIDPDLVHLIVEMKFQEYMTLIYGNYSFAKIEELVQYMAIFTEAGTKAMVSQYIQNKN